MKHLDRNITWAPYNEEHWSERSKYIAPNTCQSVNSCLKASHKKSGFSNKITADKSKEKWVGEVEDRSRVESGVKRQIPSVSSQLTFLCLSFSLSYSFSWISARGKYWISSAFRERSSRRIYLKGFSKATPTCCKQCYLQTLHTAAKLTDRNYINLIKKTKRDLLLSEKKLWGLLSRTDYKINYIAWLQSV